MGVAMQLLWLTFCNLISVQKHSRSNDVEDPNFYLAFTRFRLNSELSTSQAFKSYSMTNRHAERQTERQMRCIITKIQIQGIYCGT